MADDLAEVAARFGAALRQAGLPVGPGRCERFAAAVTLARPQTPRALYLCAATTLVSSKAHAETLAGVFSAVFGGLADPAGQRGAPGAWVLAFRPARTPEDMLASAARAAREHGGSLLPEAGRPEVRPGGRPERQPGEPERIIEDRFLGSAAERLADAAAKLPALIATLEATEPIEVDPDTDLSRPNGWLPPVPWRSLSATSPAPPSS